MAKREIREVYMTFAKRLKQLVDRTGLSAAEVADSIGVSPAMMSYYLSAKNMPDSARVYEIAEHFGVDPAWLFGANVNPDGSSVNKTEINRQPKSYQQAYLFDRIANASEEDLAKMAKILDWVESEQELS